ncbi:MAG: AAA family ATPase [Planctomycetaceae bacterium]|nr:ATP-binding protein [Planctomycetaceae bacterium]
MAITSVTISNFKGIKGEVTIPLKPITVILGPNSSGKSTCIHAIACLAQTVKNASNPSPMTLDGESAYVHLGRFTEVAHSRSYKESVCLGIGIDSSGTSAAKEKKNVRAVARWEFRCKRRTQETFIQSATFTLEDVTFTLKNRGKDYVMKNEKSGATMELKKSQSLIFDLMSFMRFPKQDLDVLKEFMSAFGLQNTIREELTAVRYLGPFRQSPLRRYRTHGSNPTEVGATGEAAVPMLANETVQSRSREHIKRIAGWLNQLGLAKQIGLSRVGSTDLFDVSLGLHDGEKIPLADLGYGCSQVLPVLAQCSYCAQNATLLFEQPELHLHHIAAKALVDVFIDTVKRCKANIVIETHSPEIFYGFLDRMRTKKFELDQFIAYKVFRQDKETKLDPIPIEPDDCDVYYAWEKGILI